MENKFCKSAVLILITAAILLATASCAAPAESPTPAPMPSVSGTGDEAEEDPLGKLSFVGSDSETRRILVGINAKWQLSDAYESEDVKAGDLDMEWLHGKDGVPEKAILHLHGGAYYYDLDYYGNQYRRMAEKYADISGAAVLTPDYRVAPADPYPAALEDAVAAYGWLLDRGFAGDDIIVAGDSAGGGLALALTLYLRDNGMELPAGVVTMSAWTDLNYKNWTVPYVGENGRADDPYISPAYGDFSGFPPMLMQVGTNDIENDTIAVAQKAAAAGVAVTETAYQDMPHVFQALFPASDEANAAWDEAEAFIDGIFSPKSVP